MRRRAVSRPTDVSRTCLTDLGVDWMKDAVRIGRAQLRVIGEVL